MRSLGSQIKVSFHRDRRCHVGYTAQFAKEAANRFGADSRHWERWTLPEQPVVRAIQIVVPDSELEVFVSEEKNPMRWIPAPGPGRAQVFTLMIAEPREAYVWQSPEQHGHLVGTIIGPTRSSWLVHTDQALDETAMQMIKDARARTYTMAYSQIADEPPGSLRMTIWGHTEKKEDIFFVELTASDFTREETSR